MVLLKSRENNAKVLQELVSTKTRLVLLKPIENDARVLQEQYTTRFKWRKQNAVRHRLRIRRPARLVNINITYRAPCVYHRLSQICA